MKKFVFVSAACALVAATTPTAFAQNQSASVNFNVSGSVPVRCTFEGADSQLNFSIEEDINNTSEFGGFFQPPSGSNDFDITDTTFEQFSCNTQWSVSALSTDPFASDSPAVGAGANCAGSFDTEIDIILDGNVIASATSGGTTDLGDPQDAIDGQSSESLTVDWDILAQTGSQGTVPICSGDYSAEASFTIEAVN
ncbi:MAG: hypothetical protein AAF742_00345 [Pseudomonadota bacterium]